MSRTLTTLQQAAWTNRNDPEAAHALGLALIARSDYHDALEYLHRAVDLAGGHAPYHRDLAAAYLALDRPRDAETWYARAVAIAPDDVGSVSGLAATHLEWLDAPDAAIPLYLRAIQLRPDQLQPYLAFARSQVRKDPADALARGQRALGQATPSRRLLQGFAAAFVQCGHLDAAQRCGERLRAEDEHDTVALTVCGSVAAMRRDDEASHAHHARQTTRPS
jgi:tetratricopeptide (TPR) repeat protein